MKRALSVSFLLLANIVVLAHAVVPHHYHNQIPDITWGFLHKHTHCQCADPNCPFHGMSEDCLLKKICVRFGSDKQALSSFDSNVPCLIPLYSIASMSGLIDLIGVPFSLKPYLLSYHTEYIAHSLGLRAPPVC